ncbi:hypothetical protein FJT64_008406 [Amphibalanus amphitrite]|uniref:Uncharacterized protein n=1 Tax=Amphibalanus amphitrite TaxID=1232801 RepID=A0A6A4VIL4_AMPAM|nr:hypothetical protein FJT64_008406 [Amphibalanus amphitrite]
MRAVSALWLAVVTLGTLVTRGVSWPLVGGRGTGAHRLRLPLAPLEADTDGAVKRQTFLRLGRRPGGWRQWSGAAAFGGLADRLREMAGHLRPARASRLSVPPPDIRSYKRYQIRLRRAANHLPALAKRR